MAAQTTMVHVRIDEATKAKATAALDAIGLSVADAVRILLTRIVADQAFPLELKVPNAETRTAMTEADEIVRNRKPRFAGAADMLSELEQDDCR